MRLSLFMIGILVLAAGTGTIAKAQNDAWCARYSTRDGSTCGFISFQQCMATVSGIGGFCERIFQAAAAPKWHRH